MRRRSKSVDRVEDSASSEEESDGEEKVNSLRDKETEVFLCKLYIFPFSFIEKQKDDLHLLKFTLVSRYLKNINKNCET